ncbi:MAG TPA: lipocalin family protein [Steroidobacteraceae bacterium]|nr:lipocalin family protein [Steroidobacteraceae bacterium]
MAGDIRHCEVPEVDLTGAPGRTVGARPGADRGGCGRGRRERKAEDRYSAGTWVGPHGRVRALARGDVRIEPLDHWTDRGGARYPSRWRLLAPALGLDLGVHPVLADQELVTSPRYWEGAVDVTGTRSGRPIAGRGYVELVGYAGTSPGAAGFR